MGRERDSMKFSMRRKALEGITDDHTKRNYRNAVEAFCAWSKANDCKDMESLSTAVLQSYEEYLESCAEQYSAATIHTKLAPICKAAGINMREIRKPKRTSGKIARGRDPTRNRRGAREAVDPRYSRLVTLQQCTGIRRAELADLEGRDLIRDGSQLYIEVRRGKGGKTQRQWILPEDRVTVLNIFKGIGPNEKVFSAAEMRNHINLHGLRAEHARKCYEYYEKILEKSPEQADRLRASLLARWEKAHKEMKISRPCTYTKARSRFLADMDDRPYRLRGENLQRAKKAGRPTEYNRLSLMAVSVFHLSHWRLDVTVTNYMI